MLPNLLVLAWLVAVVIAALILIIRTLRTLADTGSRVVCVACGEPAEHFTSFICPRCRRDVRTVGLDALRTDSPPVRTFWKLIGWTSIVLLIAIAGTGIAALVVPAHDFISMNAPIVPSDGFGKSL